MSMPNCSTLHWTSCQLKEERSRCENHTSTTNQESDWSVCFPNTTSISDSHSRRPFLSVSNTICDDLNVSIAVKKGTRTGTKHPMLNVSHIIGFLPIRRHSLLICPTLEYPKNIRESLVVTRIKTCCIGRNEGAQEECDIGRCWMLQEGKHQQAEVGI